MTSSLETYGDLSDPDIGEAPSENTKQNLESSTVSGFRIKTELSTPLSRSQFKTEIHY